MLVRELMSKDVACVGAQDSLSAAAERMWECDCGAIPVLEGDGKQVVGMITDRDICMACWSRDVAPSQIRVSEAMSKTLYFCAPEDAIETAERIMRSKQVRRIPVLDSERRLCGILSLADIAKYFQRTSSRGAVRQVISDEVASTLADICQRPSVAAEVRASL